MTAKPFQELAAKANGRADVILGEAAGLERSLDVADRRADVGILAPALKVRRTGPNEKPFADTTAMPGLSSGALKLNWLVPRAMLTWNSGATPGAVRADKIGPQLRARGQPGRE